MSNEHPIKVLMDYLEARAAALEDYTDDVSSIERYYSDALEASGFIGAFNREDLIEVAYAGCDAAGTGGCVDAAVDAWIAEFMAARRGEHAGGEDG